MYAIAWAWDVQQRLLLLPWPAELLTQPDSKEVWSPPFMPQFRLIFKGLRVRMAMHTGKLEAIQVKHRIPSHTLFIYSAARLQGSESANGNAHMQSRGNTGKRTACLLPS